MTRKALPSRRVSTTQKATINNIRTYLTVGHFKDGSPGELFLTVEGVGGDTRLLYDTVGRISSMALQYGMPLEKLVQLLLGVKGEISGPVQHHPRIKMCSSVLDYVGRELGITYLEMEDLAHVKADDD